MTRRRYPTVALSVRGNWNERAAQIDRIQERSQRFRSLAEHLTMEVAAAIAVAAQERCVRTRSTNAPAWKNLN